MQRYANRNRDFMPYEEPRPPMPPANQLDPKDERLIEAHLEIGRLQGANDLLAEDNGRLEDENRELKSRNEELEDQQRRDKVRAAKDSATEDSVSTLIDRIERQLQTREEKK